MRDYWFRKRSAGLHHLAAVTAAAIEMTRVAWRILTERRDYQPQPPRTRARNARRAFRHS